MRFIQQTLKKIATYYLLTAVFFFLNQPLLLLADHIPFNLDSDEERHRATIAKTVAGVTVLGLLAGVVAISCWGNNGKKCCYSSYSSYSYCRPCCSSYSCSSSSSCSCDSSYSSCYSSSSRCYSSYSSSDCSDHSSCSSCSDHHRPLVPHLPEAQGIVGLGGATPLSPLRAATLSGNFYSSTQISNQNQGNISAFILMPDGTTHNLGSLPFSGSSSSLSFGPFDQSGHYGFGIRIDKGKDFPAQTKVGTVDISRDGATVERHDFVVPPHPHDGYEPPICYFNFN